MKKRLLLITGVAVCAMACRHSGEGAVSTYAGSGRIGSVNGLKDSATFSNLMGLAVDSGNNIYVADSRNNIIRKISADRIVSTLAGSGKTGTGDGKGTSASFFFPTAIAVDRHGVVYVADTQNSLIRKVMPDGTVTTIAGLPSPEIEKNRDTVAKFNRPYGIAVDKNDNVYVSDWERDMIKKISPDGKITVFAGTGHKGIKDGKGSEASFYLPEGLAIDQQGNLYVADTYNNMIRKITPDGVVSTLAGMVAKGSADGKGKDALFSHPDGLAVDRKGNIYVADVGNNKIRKITPDGTVTTIAGTRKRGADNGPLKTATFNRPYGVAVDNGGNIYVADYLNNVVRKISLQ